MKSLPLRKTGTAIPCRPRSRARCTHSPLSAIFCTQFRCFQTKFVSLQCRTGTVRKRIEVMTLCIHRQSACQGHWIHCGKRLRRASTRNPSSKVERSCDVSDAWQSYRVDFSGSVSLGTDLRTRAVSCCHGSPLDSRETSRKPLCGENPARSRNCDRSRLLKIARR